MDLKIKVFVADDHAILRHGVIKLIESDNTFEVIGEASDGKEAFDKIKKLNPDIAILDLSMPSMDGLEVARKIRDSNPEVKLVMLTMHKEEEFLNEAIDCGVKGYILKDNTSKDLIVALKTVSSNSSYISPLLSNSILNIKQKKKKLREETTSIDSLTKAEKEILRQISLNKTSREIAEELHVSFRTVQKHRVNICEKLDLKGTNRLLQYAIEHKTSISIR